MTDRCLVHGNELHFDMRSGFDICYECEREEQTRPTPPRGDWSAKAELLGARGGATPEPPTPAKCPTCGNAMRGVQPIGLAGGWMYPCTDSWHDKAVPQTETVPEKAFTLQCPCGSEFKPECPDCGTFYAETHPASFRPKKREAVTSSGAQPLRDERQLAENAYTISAFDYQSDPVGSRDWTLFWKGWQARGATQGSSPEKGKYEE